MIWQNVWAFAGLAALALPVLIHLLSRKRASLERFPTLRFLPASRLLPTRATRISDWLLLLMRLGVLATAVLALAQPLFLTAHRRTAFNKALARVIVVDTSASAHRLTPSGKRVRDSAEVVAKLLANESQASVLVHANDVRASLAGGLAWLSMQPMRGELVVVSDFQQGTIDSGSAASIPQSVGIRLIHIAATDTNSAQRAAGTSAAGNAAVEFSVIAPSSSATWQPMRNTDSTHASDLLLLAGASELARGMAALEAARSASPDAKSDSARPVAVVFPEYDKRTELLVNVSPITEAWMGDAIARIRGDSLLISAAEQATVIVSTRDSAAGSARYVVPAPYVALARNSAGRAVAFAARGQVDGRDRLLLFTLADAGSLSSAALIAAALHAVSSSPNVAEFDGAVIPDAVLKRWEREAVVQAPRATATMNSDASNALSGESDGRWFWVLAILLLGIEAWVRRERAPNASEVVA